ncbi:MAG: hypothetical protein Q4D05_04930 [Acinetobacter sp.]|nr:hypothetical protein [Acinetobacter sp.]
MHHYAKIILTLPLIASVLAACVSHPVVTTQNMVKQKIHQSDTAAWQISAQALDHITHMGFVGQPIANHEYAILWMGAKHTYLLESLNKEQQATDDLLQLFKTIDIKQLAVDTKTMRDTQGNAALRISFNKENKQFKDNQAISYLDFDYHKAVAEQSEQERHILQKVGADCTTGNYCNIHIKARITLLPPIAEQQKLGQSTSPPMTVYASNYNPKTIETAIYKGLYPISKAVDFATPYTAAVGLAVLPIMAIWAGFDSRDMLSYMFTDKKDKRERLKEEKKQQDLSKREQKNEQKKKPFWKRWL